MALSIAANRESVAFRCPTPLLSEMKTVAKFSGELPGVIPVSSAERIGVVEEIPRIGAVLRGERDAEAFAEGFSERESKLGMAREMVGTVFVEETRAVAQVSRGKRAPRQDGMEAGAERIPLIVVEQEKALVRRSEVSEAAGNSASAFNELVGVGEIDLEALGDSR